MRWNGFLAATIAALLVAAAPAAANTYSVTGTDDIPGSCAGTACSSMRAALTAAAGNPGQDQVDVPAGYYQLTSAPLELGNVVLLGAGARTTTIVGTSTSRVIEIHNATATVSRVTLTGGTATDAAGYFGGNLAAYSSTVLLDHVRITGGSGYSGGGLANRNGSMAIQNSLIDHNQAVDGGGDGGGIINFGGDVPGAGAMTIKDSTIAFNTARLAGGIISRGNAQNSLAFEGVTLARNTATNIAVGGVDVPAADGGSFSTRGSLFARNQGPSGNSNCDAPALVTSGGNVDDGVDCGFDGTGDSSDSSANLDDGLRNYGGETDVIPFLTPSPALNRGGTCSALDQTDVQRPLDGACDAGAWEYRINRKITISDGLSGSTSSQSAAFDFGSDAGGPYECRLFTPTDQSPSFQACTSGASYDTVQEGAYRFEVVPAGTREPGQGDVAVFTVDRTAPTATITAPEANAPVGTDPTFTFSSSEPDSGGFECSFTQGTPPEWVFCESPQTYNDLELGHTYTLHVRAYDAADNRGPEVTRTFTVVQDDGTAPAVAITSEPSDSSSPAFTFASDDPGATFTCSLDGAQAAPCTSGVTYPSLAAGAHTFRVSATDVFGHSSSAERAFTVAAPQPAQTPTATPTATPPPSPPPVVNKSVEATKVSGTVLVKVKGTNTFVPLADAVIGNGSQVDARFGVVVITTSTGEKATFYAGLFTIVQSGRITTLTLSEALDCKQAKGKARAAAKKPKTRKLWGEGKGKFRTKGTYSAATVRGTKWLVTDTCTATVTRVIQGVVSVRDEVKKKTVTLRKGKSYTARAKK